MWSASLLIVLLAVVTVHSVPGWFGGKKHAPEYEINPNFGFRSYHQIRYEPMTVPFDSYGPQGYGDQGGDVPQGYGGGDLGLGGDMGYGGGDLGMGPAAPGDGGYGGGDGYAGQDMGGM